MSYFRAAYKFIIFVLLILSFFPVAIITWYLAPREDFSRHATRITSQYSKWFLKLMNVHIELYGDVHDVKPGSLIVCNHMSYMDVLITASLFPSCFITSMEIKNTPFLGWLCQLGGCVFVERRSRSGLDKEIQEITNALKNGLNVVLYPEATSTDGVSLRRFKRPLFRPARIANTSVVPLALNYVTVSGKHWSIQNNDFVCWYGDMPFFSHLINIFKQTEITAHLFIGSPIKAADHDETQLAIQSQEQVFEHFTPVLIP